MAEIVLFHHAQGGVQIALERELVLIHQVDLQGRTLEFLARLG